MSYEIKNRWTDAVLWASETANSVREALIAAVESGADLGGADLRGADLGGANLRDANLRDANLRDANLGGANLRDANLRDANLGGANLRDANLGGADLGGADLGGADLRGADLGGANLRDANLRDANLRDANLGGANLRDADLGGADLGGADLRGANLRDANLGGANLRDADLGGANLRDADLQPIRDDLWAVLSASPREVQFLRDALASGKVDGSTYEGDCACLVGTIAHGAGVNFNCLPFLQPNANRPIERFFMSINPGDTPENSQFSAIALEWVDQWLKSMREAFGPVASNV